MIQEFLTKAHENLDVAKLTLEYVAYNASANRSYYASFQAAIAALADAGIKKQGYKIPHDWVQSQFSGVLVQQRKLYAGSMKSYLMDMQALRDDADYSADTISKINAERQFKKANEFVQSITQRIQP
jgi:uncharacterized protein (UPF0332 family)